MLDCRPRQDTLAFQVDLWSARGELPRNLAEVATAAEGDPVLQPHPRHTDQFKQRQRLRSALAKPACEAAAEPA